MAPSKLAGEGGFEPPAVHERILLNRYALRRSLGQGAFGAVHLAYDYHRSREVALKMLQDSLAGSVLEMLREEFRVVSQLHHPNIVEVHDLHLGDASGPFFTLEYLRGPSYADCLPRARELLVAEGGPEAYVGYVAETMIHVLSALRYTHSRGILHGDVKPRNILFAADNEAGGVLPAESVKLVDFGLHLSLGGASEGVSGTPEYTAPEQFEDGGLVDHRTDLYSLGVVLYEALTGDRPLSGLAIEERLRAPGVPADKLPSRRRSDVPTALDGVVERMLRADPELRYQRAEDIIEALLPFAPSSAPDAGEVLRRSFVFDPGPALRGRPLDELKSAYQASSERKGCVVATVTGELGAGKRRLLREFRVYAQCRKSLLVDVRLRAGSHRAVELMRQTLERLTRQLGTDSREVGVDLRELSGELEEGWNEQGRGAADGSGAEQAAEQRYSLYERFAEAVAMALDALPAEGPLTWALHGIEHADPTTYELIEYVSHTIAGRSLLLLLCYDAEVLPERGARQLRGSLADGYQIRLGKLTLNQIDGLLAANFGIVRPRQELAEFVHRQGGGNLLMTRLVVESLVAGCAMEYREGSWRVDVAAARSAEFPSSLTDLLLERLSELPKASRQLVERVALLGDEFERGEVGLISDQAGEAVSERLNELVHAGVLIRVATVDEQVRYGFRHPALRQGLLERLPESARRELHQRVADSLMSRYESGDHDLVFRIADHLWLAGEFERGSRFTMLAAHRAREALDYERTLGLLERLRRHSEQTGAPHGDLLVQLGESAFEAGQYDLGSEYFRAALAARSWPPRKSAELLERLGRTASTVGRVDDALENFARAREQLGDEEAPVLRVGIGSGTAYALLLQSRPEAALEMVGTVAGLADEETHARSAADLLSVRGNVLRVLGKTEAAQTDLQRCLELHRQRGDQIGMAKAYNSLGALWVDSDSARAIEWFKQGCEVATRRRRGALLLNIGVALFDLGEWDESAQHYLDAAALLQQMGMDGFQAHLNLGTICRERGQYDKAAAHYEKADRASRLSGSHRDTGLVRLAQAQLLLDEGDRVGAEEMVLRDEPMFHPERDSLLALRRDLLRAALLIASDDFVAAERVSTEVYNEARRLDRTFSCGEALLHLGLAQCRLGRGREASQSLLEACELFERKKAAYWLARSRLTLCRAYAELGRPGGDWEGLLGSAEAVFKRIDSTRWLETTREFRHQVERHRWDEQRPHRQLDVVKQLAELIEKADGLDEFLEDLLDTAIKLMRAERGFVMRKDRTGKIRAIASRGADDETVADARQISHGILQRSLDELRPICSADALHDPSFQSHLSVRNHSIRSIICAPFKLRDGEFGTIYVDHRYRRALWGQTDADFLGTFATLAATTINEKLEKQQELTALRHQVSDVHDVDHIIAVSPAMQEVLQQVRRIQDLDTSVLIHGETGTGKELVAQAIHRWGRRRKAGPLVAVNCAALPEALIEGLLFGHERGAFTGATTRQIGTFESANGGTMFLDEIAETPPSVQAKLLRVLEDGRLTRLGGNNSVNLDVRFVAATNRSEAELRDSNIFRSDLYFRLAGFDIRIPPLRDRPEDIPALVRSIATSCARKFDLTEPEIPKSSMDSYLEYEWPGNVRELRNAVQRAMFNLKDGVLPPFLREAPLQKYATVDFTTALKRNWTGRKFEREYTRYVYEQLDRNKKATCERLKINYRTLVRRLKEE